MLEDEVADGWPLSQKGEGVFPKSCRQAWRQRSLALALFQGQYGCLFYLTAHLQNTKGLVSGKLFALFIKILLPLSTLVCHYKSCKTTLGLSAPN